MFVCDVCVCVCVFDGRYGCDGSVMYGGAGGGGRGGVAYT